DLIFVCDTCGAQGYGPNRTVNDPMMEGGFEELVWGYLTSGRGALKESDVPYFSELDGEPAENFDELQSFFKVTDIVSVVPTVENLKRGIMSYGAMTLNCAVDSYKANIVQNGDGRYSYTIASTKMMPEMGAHAMSVVGFDDSFSKDNFSIDRANLTAQLEDLEAELPPKLELYLDLWNVESLAAFKAMSDEEVNALFLPKNDGAWLVKNSWGEGVRTFQGQGAYDFCGLIWISYEDASLYNLLPDSRAYAVTGINTSDTSVSYQLDEFGAANHYAPKATVDAASYAVANIFDFGDGSRSKLDYITFETANGKGGAYEVYYSGVDSDGGIPADYNLMRLLESGVIPHDGYVTIKITDDIILPEGKGALVMKVASSGAPIKFGMDTAFFDWYHYGNEVIQYYFPIISGDSYVLSGGKLFSPFEAFGRDADFSLKAGITPTQEVSNISVGYADYTQAMRLLATLNAFSLDEKLYTKESWAQYKAALTKLQTLSIEQSLAYSEQQAVDDAVLALNNAIDRLDNKHTWEGVIALLALVAALITISLMTSIYFIYIRKAKK
ncbi:MAG: lectin like domain-containing protein, partial [Clostridia bacterium]|nr:lectin like domain-containing protein [Clostridia bacterium]